MARTLTLQRYVLNSELVHLRQLLCTFVTALSFSQCQVDD